MINSQPLFLRSRFLTERSIVILLLAAIGVLFFFLAAMSENNEGGADAFEHYFMSRYAFQHPKKFFDLWGKPVFTILSSPFSQFGILGTKTYNILVALTSAFACYLIAKKLRLKYPLLVIFFLCFMPMYFMVSISSLTEISFGLVLILAVYFMMDERYNTGAAMISFLPFARQEGVFIILIFLVYLLWKKKFVAIPFLTFGFLFFSVAGYQVYHNFWWIIKEETFQGGGGVYGHGELFHFIVEYEVIIGEMLGVLLILGLIFFFKKVFESQRKPSFFLAEEMFLIYGVFIAFLAGHSYVWWKGTNGSLGLTRVMAGGLPLAAIICLNGFNLVSPLLNLSRFVKLSAFSFMLLIVLVTPFAVHNIPIPFNDDGRLMQEACSWIKKSEHRDKVICYYDPMSCYFLDRDPFNSNEAIDRIPNREQPEKDLANNCVVIWDAHFGPNEAQMPLERLTGNPNFKLLKAFIPKYPFKTLNNFDYEIYVFLHQDVDSTGSVKSEPGQ